MIKIANIFNYGLLILKDLKLWLLSGNTDKFVRYTPSLFVKIMGEPPHPQSLNHKKMNPLHNFLHNF
jgi:hypothetical protein